MIYFYFRILRITILLEVLSFRVLDKYIYIIYVDLDRYVDISISLSCSSMLFFKQHNSTQHKSASAECGASAQNQATTHRQNCHNIAMFIFDKWKSEIKQNGYYSSFHFFS